MKRDQILATINSPDLRSRLAQEASTLASLEAEADRAVLDAELVRADARKSLDQATVDQTAAQRDLERNRRAFEGGAVAQIDVARAQDELKKSELALISARKEFELQGRGAGLDTRYKRRSRAAAMASSRSDTTTTRTSFIYRGAISGSTAAATN